MDRDSLAFKQKYLTYFGPNIFHLSKFKNLKACKLLLPIHVFLEAKVQDSTTRETREVID